MGFDWRAFDRSGWAVVEKDDNMSQWIVPAKKATLKRLNSNDFDKKQFRCGGKWFVGVNFLENDKYGRLDQFNFDGIAVNAIRDRYGELFSVWDKAQVSICYEGYPKPSDDETAASFAYRKNKFGAHVDGILPLGKTKRRYAQEYHAFILGIPLESYDICAAPLVVWEGSHRIIRNHLSKKLLDSSATSWKHMDITDIYHKARREVIFKCKKKIIRVPAGGSYILHRLALHGIMPWEKIGNLEESSRMIVYFRPALKEPQLWLDNSI